jgi:tetratricopeptide (TPR) repeat protein
MRVHPLAGTLLLFVVAAACVGQTPRDNTAIEREIQSGTAALRQGRYAEAKDHFLQAEKLSGTPSAEINAGIAMSELQIGHFEIARQRETKVLEMVSSDHARAEAHNIIGMAWLRESAYSTAIAGQLQAAEDSFRQAVQLDPQFDSAYFNLGDALRREGKESEAAAAFRKFIEAAAKDHAQDEGLPLTPQRPAPAYRLTDSQGRVLSSDLMRGRFVLLDFWATWCPPCIRALPVMRELARYFPPTQLTVISIDENSPDESVWRSFIRKKEMDWKQAWDKGAEAYYSFGLASRPDLSLPRYVLLDPDNMVLRVYSGTDRLGFVAGQVVRTVSSASSSAPSARGFEGGSSPARTDQ